MIHFKLTSRLLNNMVFLLTVILGFAIFGSGFGEDGDNATVADNAAQANETVGARAIPRRLVDCKVNEVYNRCGTACQPTCFELTPECTKECVEGCFCKEGYLRNQEKVCVHPSECQAKPCGGIGVLAGSCFNGQCGPGFTCNIPGFFCCGPPPATQPK